MKYRLTALACATLLIGIAACGGHSSSTLPVAPGGPGTFTGTASFDWGKDALNGSSYIGPAHVGRMQVNVIVNQQNLAGLIQFSQQVNDPSSPLYRQFLNPQDIAARFGATRQDYQKAADYFVAKGLTVAGWPQRMALSVAGPQAAMERAFGTTFGLYAKDGYQFVAPVSTPHFTGSVPVTTVSNLVALHTTHTYVIPAPPRANGNDTLGYSPQQIRNAFDYTGAYKAGYNGSGVTIGIIGTGPINVPRTNYCADADLAAIKTLYNIVTSATACEVDVTPSGVSAGLAASGIPTAAPGSPAPNVTPTPNPGQSPTSMFPYSGSFQSPPPVSSTACTGSLPACNPEDLEAQLDLQQTALLAPGAKINFYLAYNASDCFVYYPQTCNSSGSNAGKPFIGLTEADPEIQQVISDDAADVVSLSYGGGEPQQVGFGFNSAGIGFETAEFAEMAAEGIATFVSSGDSGSAECLGGTNGFLPEVCVSYPSGDKNVTSVGGVNAPINEFGQISGNITAWGVTNGGNGGSTPSNAAGSGGGTSTIFSAPVWQQSAIGASMREQPDVSLDADPLTGITVWTNGSCSGCGGTGGPSRVGGTSVAAPEMAAMWALVVQGCKTSATCTAGGTGAHAYRLGNAAPYFYGIFKSANQGGTQHVGFAPFLPYGQVFLDVVYGSNAMPGSTPGSPVPGATAGPAYDQVTGLGVPFARNLIKAVTNQ